MYGQRRISGTQGHDAGGAHLDAPAPAPASNGASHARAASPGAGAARDGCSSAGSASEDLDEAADPAEGAGPAGGGSGGGEEGARGAIVEEPCARLRELEAALQRLTEVHHSRLFRTYLVARLSTSHGAEVLNTHVTARTPRVGWHGALTGRHVTHCLASLRQAMQC